MIRFGQCSRRFLTDKVYVVGVGMTKFEKPGSRKNFDYPEMAKESGTAALKDAGIKYTDVDFASVGFVYGDSCSGQEAMSALGHTGIPVINVNNQCSTGSTAIMTARSMIMSGACDVAMALGFEKMAPGSLPDTHWPDRPIPGYKVYDVMKQIRPTKSDAPAPLQVFGNSGLHHMDKYGTKQRHFTKIAAKNKRHSTKNPFSQFQIEMTEEEIDSHPTLFGMLNRHHCCPTSDGSGAAVLMSEAAVAKYGLKHQAVEILAQALTSDMPNTLDVESTDPMKLAGYECSKEAARRVYEQSGIKPEEVDVVELHDCFSANELVTYEALQLCPPGGAGEFIDSGNNTYGGRVVVNPSGGLISKGHPLGATGLAQCSELCWQLRGMAGLRQVPNAKIALQHNLGLHTAITVTMYRLGFPSEHSEWVKKNGSGVHPMPIVGEYYPKKPKSPTV